MGNAAYCRFFAEPLLSCLGDVGSDVGRRLVRALTGNLLVVFLLFTGQFLVASPSDAEARMRSLFESPSAAQPNGPIDELVFALLTQLGIEPAHLCSDTVFVRRIYLDVIGTLPSPTEVQQFLQDRTVEKRRI